MENRFIEFETTDDVIDDVINGKIIVIGNELIEEHNALKASAEDHIADTANPHAVTKTQVGLGNADNTADANKNVLSATKLATARTVTIGSSGKTFDGSGNVSYSLEEIGAATAMAVLNNMRKIRMGGM
jgi:hypothetical protein